MQCHNILVECQIKLVERDVPRQQISINGSVQFVTFIFAPGFILWHCTRKWTQQNNLIWSPQRTLCSYKLNRQLQNPLKSAASGYLSSTNFLGCECSNIYNHFLPQINNQILKIHIRSKIREDRFIPAIILRLMLDLQLFYKRQYVIKVTSVTNFCLTSFNHVQTRSKSYEKLWIEL